MPSGWQRGAGPGGRWTRRAASDFSFASVPDRVLEAVEAGGFEPTGHCTALTCLENRVCDLRLEGGQHVVVKFWRPGRWSRPVILDEHRYLARLAEAEIPVCAPFAFAVGQTLRRVEGIHYTVWTRSGGRFPDAFPHFGTPRYRENEARDLESHVQRLLCGGEDVPAELRREVPEEPELASKDLFWDL